MEKRKCKKCGLIKPIDDFDKRYNDKYKKYYIRYQCKECSREYSRNNARKYYASAHGKEKQKEYLTKNRETILKKCRERTALYRETHKEEIHTKNKIYREKNKEKINGYFKERYKHDDIYRFKNTIRNSIRMSFRRKGKLQPKLAKEILGCDFDFLIKYLIETYENRYNEKWTWEYLDYVDIDHKKPLALANTEEEIINLCHYSNLQLLKTEDNLKKQAKYIG